VQCLVAGRVAGFIPYSIRLPWGPVGSGFQDVFTTGGGPLSSISMTNPLNLGRMLEGWVGQ